MNICVPKEKRTFEFRVGLTPLAVQMLTKLGHLCFIEHEAGIGAGFSDHDYQLAGGHIVYSSQEIFGRADLLFKVGRPLREEIEWLCPGAVVAGLLHLASARHDKLNLLIDKEITTVAYEQIQFPDGAMPVRRPLSQIGGRLSAQIGARLLQNDSGGTGILLGGIAGVPPAEVVILGAGTVGNSATSAFLGMGAHVTVLDTNLDALQYIYDTHPGLATLISNPINIARACAWADLVVGAVYITGERSPQVVTREMVKAMKPRSVIIDISIDEGGCVETSHPTTHQTPIYIEEGVIHYCVPNIPSAVARTSTFAFLNAALPFIFEITNKGIDEAMADNPALKQGVQIYRGEPYHLPGFSWEPV
jgi:alanine dehydrogenase